MNWIFIIYMVAVCRISAVTLEIKNMKISCDFYSRIPGFELLYGGSLNDSFITHQIGKDIHLAYLNLELIKDNTTSTTNLNNEIDRIKFERISFHTYNVDKLYWHFKNDVGISNTISFENEPKDAPWGERYFHIRVPDGYQLSFI